MIAFEVLVNKTSLCIAGVDPGVTTIILSRVKDTTWQVQNNLSAETTVSIGGLDSRTGDSVRWVDRILEVGDELLIRVVESVAITPFSSMQPRNPEDEHSRQCAYVERMAAQLGWKIQKPA